jgi:hypothetical protein
MNRAELDGPEVGQPSFLGTPGLRTPYPFEAHAKL